MGIEARISDDGNDDVSMSIVGSSGTVRNVRREVMSVDVRTT